MRKIRTGNDVHIIWTITKNDEILESIDDLNLEGAEVLLIDSFNHPAPFEYAITSIDESTAQVAGTFFGKDQKTQGKYRLLLVKNKDEEGMITLDFVDAFILTCVSKFGVMSGNDESSITTATVELDSQFNSYNGTPDMTGYFTKQECNDEFVHKSEQWAEDNPEGEVIYGYKSFTMGSVEFNGYSVTLPDTDLVYLEYGGLTLKDYVEGRLSLYDGGVVSGAVSFKSVITLPSPDEIKLSNGATTLQQYVAEHGGGGGGSDLSNYYTKGETQNYVTSRIIDNTSSPSHSNTWTSYAITDYVRNAMPQMSDYYTKSETQNYVTSRIIDNTSSPSHSNTWTSYAISDFVNSKTPQTYQESTTVGDLNVYGATVKQNNNTSLINGIVSADAGDIAGVQYYNVEESFEIGQVSLVKADNNLNVLIGVANENSNDSTNNYNTFLQLNKSGLTVILGNNGEKVQFPSADKVWLGNQCVGDIYVSNYYGNVFDNFANCTPILTKEYTITSQNYKRLFTFTNSTQDLKVQSGWCEGRITITNQSGTINGKYSFLVRLNGQIQAWLQCQDIGTNVQTRGLYQIILRTPNASNNGSDWMVDILCHSADATTNARNVKLEIISKSDNCTIVATDENATYAGTSPVTIQNNANNLYYNSAAGALQINANTANSALHLSNRLTKYINVNSNVVGEAIAAGNLIFASASDNKLYNISNTTEPIDLDGGVMAASAAMAVNGNAAYNFMATILGNTLNLDGMSTTYPSTWSTGRPLYLKCSYPDSNGNIYSLNELTLDKSVGGFTYYCLGRQTSTVQRIALNTENSQFYSLNASGKLTHINGMEIA